MLPPATWCPPDPTWPRNWLSHKDLQGLDNEVVSQGSPLDPVLLNFYTSCGWVHKGVALMGAKEVKKGSLEDVEGLEEAEEPFGLGLKLRASYHI